MSKNVVPETLKLMSISSGLGLPCVWRSPFFLWNVDLRNYVYYWDLGRHARWAHLPRLPRRWSKRVHIGCCQHLPAAPISLVWLTWDQLLGLPLLSLHVPRACKILPRRFRISLLAPHHPRSPFVDLLMVIFEIVRKGHPQKNVLNDNLNYGMLWQHQFQVLPRHPRIEGQCFKVLYEVSAFSLLPSLDFNPPIGVDGLWPLCRRASKPRWSRTWSCMS